MTLKTFKLNSVLDQMNWYVDFGVKHDSIEEFEKCMKKDGWGENLEAIVRSLIEESSHNVVFKGSIEQLVDAIKDFHRYVDAGLCGKYFEGEAFNTSLSDDAFDRDRVLLLISNGVEENKIWPTFSSEGDMVIFSTKSLDWDDDDEQSSLSEKCIKNCIREDIVQSYLDGVVIKTGRKTYLRVPDCINLVYFDVSYECTDDTLWR